MTTSLLHTCAWLFCASAAASAQGVLWTVQGTVPQNRGTSIAVLHDIDGDGIDDVLTGMTGDSTIAFASGAARVLSGATGAAVFTVYGSQASDQFGCSVE